MPGSWWDQGIPRPTPNTSCLAGEGRPTLNSNSRQPCKAAVWVANSDLSLVHHPLRKAGGGHQSLTYFAAPVYLNWTWHLPIFSCQHCWGCASTCAWGSANWKVGYTGLFLFLGSGRISQSFHDDYSQLLLETVPWESYSSKLVGLGARQRKVVATFLSKEKSLSPAASLRSTGPRSIANGARTLEAPL